MNPYFDRQEAKRKAIEERKQLRAKLTNTQQLAVLDHRLGKGEGAKKERARLIAEAAVNYLVK